MLNGMENIKHNHLNQKNSTLHLLQASNNIRARERDANVMLFAWMPLNTSFDGDDNNNVKQSVIMLNGIENIKQQSTSTRKI